MNSEMLNLSPVLKRVYKDIYYNLCNDIKNTFIPINASNEDIMMITYIILCENYKFVKYSGKILYQTNLLTKSIELETKRYNNLDVFYYRIQKIVNVINSKTNKKILKIKLIYDFLKNNVNYCYSNNHDCYSAYGVIMEGKAVCQGIAYSFAYLANELGIKTIIVNGDLDNERHSWNIIQIDNMYYHIDVTHEITTNAFNAIDSYDYFCLCDNDLLDRNWNKSIYPKCNSKKYNYFTITNTYVHDLDSLINLAVSQIKYKKIVYLRYTFINSINTDYLVESILKYANKDEIYIRNVKYMLNEKLKVFKLINND